MPDLNIRNVDESLMRELKARAAGEGFTLRDWAIKALWGSVNGKREERREDRPGKPKERGPAEGEGRVEQVQSSPKSVSRKEEPMKFCQHGLLFCQICRRVS
jgi:hypothetical protein